LLDPAPRTLVGAAQSATLLRGVSSDELGQPSSDPPVSSLHTIWEAVDPLTGVAATRTYALSNRACCAEGDDQLQLEALLHAYAAIADCCLHLLHGGPLAASAVSCSRFDELKQQAAAYMATEHPELLGRLELFCVGMDAMGLVMPANAPTPPDASLLLFLRIALVDMPDPQTGKVLGTVAYGDSVFVVPGDAVSDGTTTVSQTAQVGDVLTEALPRFAQWLAVSECEQSGLIKAGLDSAQGIGIPEVPHVAIGHRPGVRVPLEPLQPFPDPLCLGNILEAGVRSSLAVDVGTKPGTVAGRSKAEFWSFDSGKVVVLSPRTGHVVLCLARYRHCFPCAQGPEGLVWVPVKAVTGRVAARRLAVAVGPTTAAAWRTSLISRWPEVEPEVSPEEEEADDLQWLRGLKDDGSGLASSDSGLDPSRQLLSALALRTALVGRPLLETRAARLAASVATVASQQSCRCTWVSGLPGCAVLDVASALARALGAALIDLCTIVGLDARGDALVHDLPGLAATMAAALREVAGRHASLVVCDVRCVPAEVLLRLSEQKVLADLVQITHVVSSLEPLVCYPWGSAWHPLVVSRSHRAWVSMVAVQDCRPVEAAQRPILGRGRSVLKERLLRELRACRGSGQVLERPPTSALVDSLLLSPLASAARLAVALPEHGLDPGRSACGSRHILRSAFVAISSPLDITALRASLAVLLSNARKAACPVAGDNTTSIEVWRGLFCIESRVQGAVPKKLWSLKPSKLQRSFEAGDWLQLHQFVLTPQGELRTPQQWAAPLDTSEGIVAWWCVAEADLEADRATAFQHVVASCRMRPPQLEHPWASQADIPQEDVARLAAEVQGTELPDGYFASNTGYVDVNGKLHKQHPELQGRLLKLIADHNEGVEVRNAVFRGIAAMPCFGGL